MTWFEILSLVGGTGIILGIGKLIFHLGKIANNIENMISRLNSIDKHLDTVDNKLTAIDNRISHLEGAFFERGQWEARSYKIGKTMIDPNNPTV